MCTKHNYIKYKITITERVKKERFVHIDCQLKVSYFEFKIKG